MFHFPLLLAQEAASSTAAVSSELFSGLGNDERFVIIIVAIGCTAFVLIVSTICITSVVGSIHQRNAEYDLKREMLDRGMTSEEITEVIQAAPLEKGVESWIATWGKQEKTRKHT